MKKKNTGIHTLYIGNLSYNRDENGVLGLVKKYGFIKNIKILREGKQNKSKGVAFVDMVNLDDANKAITELNGMQVDGRTLKASLAKTQNFEVKSESEREPKLSKTQTDNLHKREKRLNKREGLNALFQNR